MVDIVSIEGSFFHDISGSLGLEPYLDFSSKMREVLTARGRAVLDEFCGGRQAREDRGRNRDSTWESSPTRSASAPRAADLVMIGHRGVNERFSTGLLGSTAESVARKMSAAAVRLADALPRDQAPGRLPTTAASGPPSAMHAAAEFASELGAPLTVVTVARDPKIGERALDEARNYFEPYHAGGRVQAARGPRARGDRAVPQGARHRPAVHRRVRPQPDNRDGAGLDHRVRAAQRALPGVFVALAARGVRPMFR